MKYIALNRLSRPNAHLVLLPTKCLARKSSSSFSKKVFLVMDGFLSSGDGNFGKSTIIAAYVLLFNANVWMCRRSFDR